MKKILSLALIIITIVAILPFAMTGSANNTGEYVLYKNDAKFSLDEYPAIEQNGEIYVPSSFFIGFKSIFYEYSGKYKSFYFMNKDTGAYFAFSFNTDTIIANGEYTQKSFPIINSTIYMPLEYCATFLSLKLEKQSKNGIMHIRLSDNTEEINFSELIDLFNPPEVTEPPIVEPIDPPIEPIDPPIPPTEPEIPLPPTDEKPQKKSVYLLVTLDETDFIKDAIKLLLAFGERATLVFDEESLKSAPKEVFHALINGNSIALLSKSEKSEEEIREANKTLSLIANFSTRLCLAPVGASLPEGYTNLIPDIDVSEYSSDSAMNTANAIHEKASEQKVSYVKISATRDNYNLLVAILGIFANDENFEICVPDSSFS